MEGMFAFTNILTLDDFIDKLVSFGYITIEGYINLFDGEVEELKHKDFYESICDRSVSRFSVFSKNGKAEIVIHLKDM